MPLVMMESRLGSTTRFALAKQYKGGAQDARHPYGATFRRIAKSDSHSLRHKKGPLQGFFSPHGAVAMTSVLSYLV